MRIKIALNAQRKCENSRAPEGLTPLREYFTVISDKNPVPTHFFALHNPSIFNTSISMTATRPLSLAASALYADATQWAGDKTMQHASGLWGRIPMLAFLKDQVIMPGNTILDFGCGAGFPSRQMAEMVGSKGRVIGVDSSQAMLDAANKQYPSVTNLSFHKADATQRLHFAEGCADVVTTFMVCHNLKLQQLQSMLRQAARLLKRGTGRAVMLTMHPEALDSDPPWDLDFSVYDPTAIARYQHAEGDEKEGIEIHGMVKNVDGGEKAVTMIHHTHHNMICACDQAGLTFHGERSLWIDEATAVEKFGTLAVRKVPTTPTFWILDVRKK